MATKYLQLRVHGLQCIKKSTNVQNFMGIPLELDSNSIDVSAIITDASAGVVAQAPPVHLGHRFEDGRRETFADPKVIGEIPFSDDDAYPRRALVTLNIAEKDDGDGFGDLVEGLARELGDALAEEVGGSLDSGVRESEYYDLVENTAKDVIADLAKMLVELLGLSDDPFQPVTLEHELRGFDHAPSGTGTIELREVSPHQGKYVLTYGWHVSTTRAIAASTGPVVMTSTGRSSAALSGLGVAANPYPRPFRTFRFARPMKKRAVPVTRPSRTTKKLPRFWWHATPVRLFSKASVTAPK